MHSCPSCKSADTNLLSDLNKSGVVPLESEAAPPARRNNARIRLIYVVVLVCSWAIIPISAAYFVTISFMRYHLEMPWILKLSDFQLLIPAIIFSSAAIVTLRIMWLNCTTVMTEDNRWNRDEHPKAMTAWEHTRRCGKCNHRWLAE
ncbi:MAG: hypothetical protein ABI579_08605 [Candidatus Sumerlaeota bacterium]